ncbi:MAG: hypothetical protein Q8R28_05005 [Dehalococcoidia bacterium]|nr:hypothetical protein [Dehalococcoidia bacterium]
MKIEITLRPGVKEVAYFADVTFEDKINLLGCACFFNQNNSLRVSMPSRKTDEGKHFPVVTLAPSLAAAVELAVLEAINSRRSHAE